MKILLLMLSGIGDCLMAMPAVRALRKRFPNSEITVIVNYRTAGELCRRMKEIDEVIVFDFLEEGYLRSLQFVLQQRKRAYDVSFLLYPANRWQMNLISFLIHARKRLSHRYGAHRFTNLGFLQTQRIPISFYRHAIDENLELTRLVGVDAVDRTLRVPCTSEEEKYAEEYWKRMKIKRAIGIHAGSSTRAHMERKRWPAERFGGVCDRLAEKECQILLFGGEEEKELNENLARAMNHTAVLAPSMSFFGTASLIKKCALFVCNDTALMHVAASQGVPVVVIEGPINPYKTWPLSSKSRVLYAGLECQPCYRIGEDITCKYREGRFDCLKMITEDMVIQACRSILGEHHD